MTKPFQPLSRSELEKLLPLIAQMEHAELIGDLCKTALAYQEAAAQLDRKRAANRASQGKVRVIKWLEKQLGRILSQGEYEQVRGWLDQGLQQREILPRIQGKG